LKEPNLHPLFFDLLSKKWNIRRIRPRPPKSMIFFIKDPTTPTSVHISSLYHVVENKRQKRDALANS